jgi:glycosyltransferase involved in cell wall biosynthesis
MRIVHFGKYYPPIRGGMETHVETLAKNQASLGHEVYVIAINNLGKGDYHDSHSIRTTERFFDDDGVKVRLLGRFASACKLDFVRNSRILVNSFQERQNTVFHLHAPNPAFALILALHYRIQNLVVSHHSDVIGQGVLSIPFLLVEEFVYRRAKLLISDSEQYIAGSRLLTRFRSKTRVLPLGLQLEPYLNPSPTAQRIATEFKLRHKSPIWLCVGRLCRYKGLETAIRALAKVVGTLIIVGTGPMEAELKKLSEEVGVQDRVSWLGETDQDTLCAAYHAARALWFTSNARNEGFGQVQVESMACSTPVINAHIQNSGVSWVSIDDVSGLTIQSGSVDSLVDASVKISSNDKLHTRLSLGARQRAVNLFDAKSMAVNSTKLYARFAKTHT